MKNFDPEIWFERQNFNPDNWLKKRPTRDYASSVAQNFTQKQHEVETVLQRIENYRVDLTCEYDDWIKLGFAFADEFGEAGLDFFQRISQFYPEYNTENCIRQFDKCLKSKRTGITIKTFFGMARDAGINIRV